MALVDMLRGPEEVIPMRITSLFTVALASLALAACGPGPSTGDDTGDDAVEPDADPNVAPDADTSVTAKQIGESCTPDAANPQGPGDCGTGMTCLSLQGGNGAWCSKTCADNAACTTGFTGATGIPACAFGIDFGNGTPVNYCGLVCNDVAGDPVICTPATACNGTCPGTLQCSAPLNSGTPAVHVADACI